MNDPDQTMIWPAGMGDDLPERLWVNDGLAVEQESAAAAGTAGLVSLGFIKAALRRSAWLWCATAVVGLLIGSGLYLHYPPAYHAQTTVLLVDGPNEDPAVQAPTDQNLAQSQAVAGRVVKQLGLQQSVASFQAAYTVSDHYRHGACDQRRRTHPAPRRCAERPPWPPPFSSTVRSTCRRRSSNC